MFDTRRTHFETSDELTAYVAANTRGVCFLSFSNGKDSVCSWLQLRKHFKKVIPFYLEVLPGLRFIEEALTWYETFFGTRIHRYPHPATYGMLDDAVFQPPGRPEVLAKMFFSRNLTVDHIKDDLKARHRLDHAWLAIGQRATDSMHRRTAMRKFGHIRYEPQWFFPVFDWTFGRMHRELAVAGCKLPVDYALFNRSFDSVRARFLPAIREHYPDDYRRILKWFPMSQADELRRRFAAAEEGA